MAELWTPVPGYPRYELSNKGRLRYASGNYAGYIKPPVQPYTYMIWVWNPKLNCSEVRYIIISGVTQENGDEKEHADAEA